MSYLDQVENKASREGIIGTALIHLLLLIFFLLTYLSAPFPPPQERGFLVNFGETDQGKGKQQPSAKKTNPPKPTKGVKESKSTKPKAKPASKPKPVAEEKLMTSKNPDAPALPVKKPNKNKASKENKSKDKEKAEPPKEVKVEKPREANPDQLFKPSANSKDSNDATSNGITEGETDMGSTKGDINNSTNYDDMKSGPPGVGFSLSGRSLIDIPKPKDNSQAVGIVVIKIKVDKQGNVITADYISKGSTTNNSQLRRLAIESARKAKFNFDPNALEIQTGTVTFTFTTN